MENYPFNTNNMLLATYTCSQNGSSVSVDLYISVRRMKLFLGKQITLPFLPEQNRRNIWRQPFAFEMFARPSFFFFFFFAQPLDFIFNLFLIISLERFIRAVHSQRSIIVCSFTLAPASDKHWQWAAVLKDSITWPAGSHGGRKWVLF